MPRTAVGRQRLLTLVLMVVLLVLLLPYVWLIALFVIFTVGIGLILTGRSVPKWQTT